MHTRAQVGTLLGSILLAAAATAAEGEWLSICGKCWAPTIYSKSGIGTANARAEARVTREEIQGWCGNWSPGDRGCVQRELSSPDAKRTYSASADCTRGRITPIDGQTYTLAGRWDGSDIGGGRTRWRDANGRIVGRDNASGGLAISQQWEVLCPEGRSTARAAPPVQTPPQQAPRPAVAMTRSFAVGEVVYARSGPAWVRGRVTHVSQVAGPRGPELAYGVMLDGGARGVLPPHMLRKAPR
ncbi:MAG: hypothetical protein J0M28_18465 [Thauera sp.]|nr:hypothetical protein [Thauera sp.]